MMRLFLVDYQTESHVSIMSKIIIDGLDNYTIAAALIKEVVACLQPRLIWLLSKLSFKKQWEKKQRLAWPMHSDTTATT